MSFTTKFTVTRQLMDRILKLSIRKRQSNFSIVFIQFLVVAKKKTYRVVSVGLIGLTAARTAGTATVVLSKSFFRSSFLVLSW